MFDLILANGLIVDGSGAAPRKGDVGIIGETIGDTGDLAGAAARTHIDATDKIVCPGFIDAHSHGDVHMLIEPSAPSKAFQGVTTDVVGNCGASAAPITDSMRMESHWADLDFPGTWRTVGEYRTLLETVKPLPNVVFLVGHNTVRRHAGVYDNRPPTVEEMTCMSRRVEQAMNDGARGLSTGLIYPPGRFSNTDEIVALARVAAQHGGVYCSHMRHEGAGLLDAIAETLAVGEAAEIPVEISHLKTSGKGNWGRIDAALEAVETARAKGRPVHADRYPYIASHTSLTVVFPDWALEGTMETRRACLSNPGQRARLREDLLENAGERDWGAITVGSTHHPDNRRFQGRLLIDVAAMLGLDPVDAMLHLAETDAMRTSAFFAGMCENNMVRILAQPWVMIGSDASIRAPWGPLSEDHPHPRTYGTFVRFLRMALDGKTVPLPEAVRKMTALPAEKFGLSDRGLIAKGKKGDLAVIDPEQVRDLSTFAAPHQLAQGVVALAINGELAIANGELTGRRSGRFL